eukprot:336199-Hanusia_phi.AAC.1
MERADGEKSREGRPSKEQGRIGEHRMGEAEEEHDAWSSSNDKFAARHLRPKSSRRGEERRGGEARRGEERRGEARRRGGEARRG